MLKSQLLCVIPSETLDQKQRLSALSDTSPECRVEDDCSYNALVFTAANEK